MHSHSDPAANRATATWWGIVLVAALFVALSVLAAQIAALPPLTLPFPALSALPGMMHHFVFAAIRLLVPEDFLPEVSKDDVEVGAVAILFLTITVMGLIIFWQRRIYHPLAALHKKYPSIAVQDDAPYAVYFDMETNAPSATKVPGFIDMINELLHHERANLFLFADVRKYQASAYALQGYGFEIIHVFHDRIDYSDEEADTVPNLRTNIKNLVDFRMGLFVLKRALRLGRQQVIVLICMDRIYAALIRELHSMGYTIQIWGRKLPDELKVLEALKNVTCIEYGSRFDSDSTLKRNVQSERVMLPRSEGSAGQREGRLQDAFETSTHLLEVYQQMHSTLDGTPLSDDSRLLAFTDAIAAAPALTGIGLTGQRARRWLNLLAALGYLNWPRQSSLPEMRELSATEVTKKMSRLLNIVVQVVKQLAQRRRVLRLRAIRRAVLNADELQASTWSGVRKLLRTDVQVIEDLLIVAQKLGLVNIMLRRWHQVRVIALPASPPTERQS